MSDHLEEIPLFPLHAVLLPYERLQLHIFEPRYREMINNCLEYDLPFGVSLIRQGQEVGEVAEPYLVGTAARIDQVHRYPDGRMHVSVYGERRFRIRRLIEEKPYLVGMCEPLIEQKQFGSPRLLSLCAQMIEEFRLLINGMLARPDFNIDIQLPEDPTALSFVVAKFLNLDNTVKQRLLELTSTEERLDELIPLIEKQIIESKVQDVKRLTVEHLSEWITPN